MAVKKSGLGKGLDSLIKDNSSAKKTAAALSLIHIQMCIRDRIIITAIALPVISGATQFLNIKLSQAVSGTQMDENNPMAGTMKTMNMTMPLMSVFFVATLPTGIGLYWIFSALVRSLQQVLINKHLKQISVEDLIEKNKDKAEKKAKKRSEKAERINEMAQMNARSLKDSANRQVSAMSQKERDEKLENARKRCV